MGVIVVLVYFIHIGWQRSMIEHRKEQSMTDVAWTHTVVLSNMNVWGQVITKVQLGLRRDGVVVWKEIKDDWRDLNSDRSQLYFEEVKNDMR